MVSPVVNAGGMITALLLLVTQILIQVRMLDFSSFKYEENYYFPAPVLPQLSGVYFQGFTFPERTELPLACRSDPSAHPSLGTSSWMLLPTIWLGSIQTSLPKPQRLPLCELSRGCLYHMSCVTEFGPFMPILGLFCL